ncbi:MAG: hypothetical protein P8X65_13225 [Syntrophobacterales bacterium]|jgi:hypothetical protein
MQRNLLLVSLAMIVAAALSLSSCGGMQAQSKENLLSAAGFQMRLADTPAKQTQLQAMTQRKLMPHQKKGQMYYTFANSKSGRLYIGNAQNYQRYQELAAQQKVAREDYMAAEMEEQEAMDWDMWGYYGPMW